MEQFVVGIIRGSHGLKGNCKVESTSGEYDHFFDLKEVTLQKNDVKKKIVIEQVSLGDRILYVKFKGINSPEEAKLLSGYEILVPRENACPCGKDEYYIEDLKLCSLVYVQDKAKGLVEKTTPTVVGTITDVLEGGAGDLLEVVLSEGCNLLTEEMVKTSSGENRTVLVPFKKEFIGTVDISSKTVQLRHLWILE
ncbi:MAG: 16S rRNA processing protein RimM [Spirochaetaceae bacterium]|nr:16S rRNA processing protein RimM [Spirochaetaceae bacterium]